MHYDQLTHSLQKRALPMVVVALGIAIFATFWNQGISPIRLPDNSQEPGHAKAVLSRSFELPRKGWPQWISGSGNDGDGHVPALSWEDPPDDDDAELVGKACRRDTLLLTTYSPARPSHSSDS